MTEEPSVGKPGKRQRTCSRCGEVETEDIPAEEPEREVPKTGVEDHSVLYCSLMVVSLVLAESLYRYRKKLSDGQN